MVRLFIVSLLLTACSQALPPRGDDQGGGTATTEDPASSKPPDPAATDPEPTPAEQYQALETRLLTATEVNVEFAVTSEGAFTADVTGMLSLTRDRAAHLVARGTFGDATFEGSFTADADHQRAHVDLTRPGDDPQGIGEGGDRAAEVDDAILLGLLRMGILHNVARLTAGKPPDHGAGGAAAWVTVGDHQATEDGGLLVAITVAGQPAGTATLYLDEDGLPARRVQVVEFPAGEMRVEERYPTFTVD